MLLNGGFENMMAEEIYPYITDDMEEETHDEHFYSRRTARAGEAAFRILPRVRAARPMPAQRVRPMPLADRVR